MHTQCVSGMPVYLSRPFDFSFMEKYGKIIKLVENGGVSGNLCFCVEKDNRQYFVKFAGAPKAKFDYNIIDQAIGWLKNAARVYIDLAHESLIKFIMGEEAGGGYLNIFEWVGAECIGYPDPAARRRFLSLPLSQRMRAYDAILDFHAHAAQKGYVAIDFYADQILYDFENEKTFICDIDFYQKSPYYGDMGPWGSANFVSPEECVPGLRIDEITMVYTMGAAAFCLFSDYDRSLEAWPLSSGLYAAASRAVSGGRGERQQSIGEFIAEWRAFCI